MQNQITVTVAGCSGVGKSAVLQLINETLIARGFTTHCVEEISTTRTLPALAVALASVSRNPVVLVEKCEGIEVVAPVVDPNTRIVEAWIDGEWKQVQMQDLKIGQRFRMFEPDGTRVVDFSDWGEWEVEEAPVCTDGVWGVECKR